MTASVVIKVGGSLLGWDQLPARLAAFLASQAEPRKALIVGGGPPARWVRELDERYMLGDEASHFLALRALDLTAELVTRLVPGLARVERLEECEFAWSIGRLPVVVARTFLEADEAQGGRPLPRSWSVTTDTIAAVLAQRLEARSLVLLKSASLPGPLDRGEAARLGFVDPAFPEFSRSLQHVLYLNLREPHAAGVAL